MCVYKDQLKDFCTRVVNAQIYTYHVHKNLQNYAEHEEVENDLEHANFGQDANDSDLEAIKPFPIKKDVKRRR